MFFLLSVCLALANGSLDSLTNIGRILPLRGYRGRWKLCCKRSFKWWISLKQRLFTQIFIQISSDFGWNPVHWLCHSDVRWLSRGEVLQAVVALCDMTEIFLLEKDHPPAPRISDSKWLCKWLTLWISLLRLTTWTLQCKVVIRH